MPSTNENELRQFIINEMVDTEERYLEDMGINWPTHFFTKL
jgi:hypothetical protein